MNARWTKLQAYGFVYFWKSRGSLEKLEKNFHSTCILHGRLRGYGIKLFRNPHSRRNLGFPQARVETPKTYVYVYWRWKSLLPNAECKCRCVTSLVTSSSVLYHSDLSTVIDMKLEAALRFQAHPLILCTTRPKPGLIIFMMNFILSSACSILINCSIFAVVSCINFQVEPHNW